jgi:hypothetical protein
MTNKKPHLRTGSLIFCVGQCRKGNGSGGGTIFDAEFAQDAFDVLPDRPGACAEDHADLFKSYLLGGATTGGGISNHTGRNASGRPHAQNRLIEQVNHGASFQSVAVAVPTLVVDFDLGTDPRVIR